MACLRVVYPLLLLLLCVLALPAKAQWLQDTRTMMGTEVSVELRAEDVKAGNAAMERVFAEFTRLDLMMNPWNKASELARINRETAAGAISTTAEIIEVVERALHFSRLSQGAFDISFASVGRHYDYRAGIAPDEARVQQDVGNIDYRAIEIDRSAGTIAFARAGLQLDLGGIAKGYTVDRAIAILREAGITSAVVTAGGDSRILGDLGERHRVIGIRHPRKPGEYVVMIPLADTAISTSGDYERFFVRDGTRYHHILNPETGRSAKGVQSASVITDSAIDSDALSTTLFVLGVEKGLALVNRLPDVDAIIIDGEGKLHYSAELLLSTTQ